MRILHLTPTIPWPADSGGRIVMWNMIRADARLGQVGLLSFTERDPDPATLEALGSALWETELVRRPRTLDGVVGGARSLITSSAMNLAKYRWPVFSEALASFLERWSPDIVVAHHIHMAPYLQEVRSAYRVLREHNVDSVLMERYAASLSNPAMAAFARRQAEQIRDTERRLCPQADLCLTISTEDERALKEIAPGTNLATAPAAIDLSQYEPVALPEEGEDPLLVTAGSLGFRPTGEGVVEFAERAWPRIRRAVPRARFRIIGAAPESLRRRLLRVPGIEMTGRVDEVAPLLAGASAFLVPLRVGSGVRIRILEALAWGIPVITTATGCEGLEVESGRHLLVADRPDEMVAAFQKLLAHPATGQILRREGRRLVERRHSIEVLETMLGRLYRRATAPAEGDHEESTASNGA
jgi:glycosyltransferase involved in cell wall biosynthesis